MEKNIIYIDGITNNRCERLYVDLTNATLSELISIKSSLKDNFLEQTDVLESIIYNSINSKCQKMNNKIKRRKKTCRRFKQKWEGK